MQGTKLQTTEKTLILLVLSVLAHAGSADFVQAQSAPCPSLLYVSPCGGQAGSSFELTVTGQNLDQAESLYFSLPGVKSEFIGTASLKTTEVGGKKKKKTPGMTGPQRSFKFKVTLPGGARPGIQDVRVIAKGGISNPRAFVVGDLKEHVEKEPNDDIPQAQRVELNSAVSGTIASPTDVDYFIFSGKKGQRVIASCLTTSIDSKLAANIEMYGTDGRHLGSGRGYHENDALLDCVLPEDGDYLVRVADFTYTLGGPDYFYRLAISTQPWIDAVFPPALEAGKSAQVAVYGRNLPGGKLEPAMKVNGRVLDKITVTIKAPADSVACQRLAYSGWIAPAASELDGFELRVRNEAGFSNPALITFAQAPVVTDQGDNDTPEKAQKIMVPCEIAGWIEKTSDRDWYAFHAKKGEVYALELVGDRLGSPLDLYFTLRDSRGKTITEQDDSAEILSPQFFTRSYDPPPYRFTVPADGDYQLMVSSRDAFTQAGPRQRYRLRIGPEKPDFRLIAMPVNAALLPDAAVVGQGGNQAFQILVWRHDGFNADIELSARNLPSGVAVVPQTVPSGQKQSFLVIGAAPEAAPWAGAIQIVGTATVNGQKLVREARAATTTWSVPQINIPPISRLDRSLVVAVRDKAPMTLTLGADRLAAPPGGKLAIPIKLTRNSPSVKGTLQIVPLNIPNTFTFTNLSMAAGKDSAKLDLGIKANAAPGTYTLVFRAQTQPAGKVPQNRPNTGPSQPSTPIAVTVLPKQLAKVSVTPQQPKVQAGQETMLTVKVARMYDFDGPFKLELVAPGMKGIQSGTAEVRAGENQASLVLRAQPGASGNYPNVIIRATALFHGHAVVQEAKFNVTVTK